MKIETIVMSKMTATEEEKQKIKGGLEVLNAIDNATNNPIHCENSCPLAKMCNSAPCQIGCLIHYSQRIFENLIENT